MSRSAFSESVRAVLLVVALLLLASVVAATPAAAIVPLGQFGQGPGDQAGLLDSPRGVAVDGDGRLYVSEGERISVFSPQGAFLRAFGRNVVPGNARTGFEQCTTVCQAGERGGDSGEFANAHGLAVDAEGLLYVADEQQNRVSVFNQQGGFVRGFGKNVDPNNSGNDFEVCTPAGCQPGEEGSGPGELSHPIGLTVASNGTLFVVDSGNNRVSVYTLDGRFLRAFGQRRQQASWRPHRRVCLEVRPGGTAEPTRARSTSRSRWPWTPASASTSVMRRTTAFRSSRPICPSSAPSAPT